MPSMLSAEFASYLRSRIKRAVPAVLLAIVAVGGWGISFFTNSITAHLLAPNSSTFQALFLNSIGRILALLVIIPILSLTSVGTHGTVGECVDATDTASTRIAPQCCKSYFRSQRRTNVRPRVIILSWNLAVPFISQLVTNMVFFPYIVLSDESTVSVLTVMTGMHIVCPTLWGLFVAKDSVTILKLIGIASSIAAVLILGLADTTSLLGSAVTPNQIAAKVFLFLVSLGGWGAADIMNSYIRVSPPETAAMNLLANLFTAAIFAFVALAESLGGPCQPTLAFGWQHVVFIASNAAGMFGSLAYIGLGQIGEASAFAPVVALYVYVPVILSVAIFGEQLKSLQIVGVVCAGVSMVLLSISWASSKHGVTARAPETDVLTGTGSSPIEFELTPVGSVSDGPRLQSGAGC